MLRDAVEVLQILNVVGPCTWHYGFNRLGMETLKFTTSHYQVQPVKMSAVIKRRLNTADIKSMSKYDIVFEDHSMNDAIRLLQSDEDSTSYQMSLERLVLHFYSSSESSHDASYPLIVFLETRGASPTDMPEAYSHPSKGIPTMNSSLDYSFH
mmetsp:Transcript_8761/g.13079  ORF Transcript_8761/g.13079 Transcript_8761/m.13079 type:complete len:153 (-) Transcript_8761:417-875(-)